MRFGSIFSLNRFREKGGVSNVPSTAVPNPQGGNIFIPYFMIGQKQADRGKWSDCVHDVKKKGGFYNPYAICTTSVGVPDKQSKEKSASWGLGGPAIVKDNPQGGQFFWLFTAPPFKHVSEKGFKKGGPKKTLKPKMPKPIRPKKGKPVHKKLHDTIHPILAEAGKLLGHGLAKREVDSTSMVPQVTISGQGKKKESRLKIVSRCFRESTKSSSGLPHKFRVVLIEEGMGNSTDAFYYTREALESGVAIFNGMKIYVDHPTEEEESIRPERSTRDAIGHYENLSVETDNDGQSQLCADLNILDIPDTELQRAQMERAVENAEKFPDRHFVGLSINASGPSEETPIDNVIDIAPSGAKQKLIDAKGDGTETLRVVTKINRAVSCDLVTEAGAGGKILNTLGDDNGQKTA